MRGFVYQHIDTGRWNTTNNSQCRRSPKKMKSPIPNKNKIKDETMPINPELANYFHHLVLADETNKQKCPYFWKLTKSTRLKGNNSDIPLKKFAKNKIPRTFARRQKARETCAKRKRRERREENHKRTNGRRGRQGRKHI